MMSPQVTSESSAWRIFLQWYMIQNTKIVQPCKNDLKKHLQHRDRHGRQVENMVRPLGKYLEPGVRHPSGRELRHHCLLQDLRENLFSPRSSVLFLNAWSCRFQFMRSCHAKRILPPRAQTNYLRGKRQTLMLPWYDVWSMFKKPSHNFARHPKGDMIHLLKRTASTRMCLIVRLRKSDSASTTGVQDPCV